MPQHDVNDSTRTGQPDREPTTPERQPTRGPDDGTRDTREEQGSQLSGPIKTSDETVNKIQAAHPNGITVNIYGPTSKWMSGGYRDTGNNREFRTQAYGMAEVHQTVGLKGGSVDTKVAMPAISQEGIQNKITGTYNTLQQKYKAAKPANAPDKPEHLKIKNVALFYHGLQKKLHLPSGSLSNSSTKQFVKKVGPALRDDVNVQLYACQAARGEGSLAETMAKELGGNANVFGHTTSAHTTENHQARVFGTLGKGTDMFDVMFPPSFIDAEVTRIWGSLPEAKVKIARDTLKARLRKYYGAVFGLAGNQSKNNGWGDARKNQYLSEMPGAKTGYYKKYAQPGREMFLDPATTGQSAQKHWAEWAATAEAGRFGGIGTVSAAFKAGTLSTTHKPTVGSAGGARTEEEEEPAPGPAPTPEQPETPNPLNPNVILGPPIGYARVKVHGLSIRTKPTTRGNSPIATARKGDTHEVFQKVGNWLEIQFMGMKAYISAGARFTQFHSSSEPQAEGARAIGTAVVRTNGLNVRVAPSLNNAPIGGLNRGATVEVFERRGSWLQIRYQGKVAYISGGSRYARFTPS